jgi:calcium/calmodulin-dependent protein kinase I
MGCMGSKDKDTREMPGSTPNPHNAKYLVDSSQVTKGKVEDFYSVGRELGRGTFSIVKEAVRKSSGTKFAIKFIDKKFVDKDDLVLLSREIDIMKQVDHPNVLSLKEIFENASELALVMELVTGGELFFKIVEQGSYSEKDASSIVRQILEGVKYLHGMGIAHRDLKPENLLCSGGEGSDMKIKIADFGLSKIFAGGQKLETSCGTPDYAAPEVLTGESAYDKSVDLWSIGVITYVLLCGYPPFYATSQPALFERIIRAEYDFPDPEWSNISETAKDFITNRLVIDSKKRLTVEQALEHPFVTHNTASSALKIESSMQKYNTERKKAAAVLANMKPPS